MPVSGIEFEDAVDMLLFLDDDMRNGLYSPHPWQMQILKDFSVESTAMNPYMAVVRAANGSGKDKFILAVCAFFLCVKYPNAVSVITSASGKQLDRQTDTYVRQLARSANQKFGFQMWDINYRHYTCHFPQPDIDGVPQTELTSTIEMFATDTAGFAEGWHPITHNGQLGIFTSETKSIPNEICESLVRCTGVTKRMDVSSPGLPMGHFFNRCTSGSWKKYHITAYDCPHLSKEYIEQCRQDYGEHSSLFKTMVLAEFGTTDEQVVIPYHLVWNAIHNNRATHIPEPHNTAGLDLAAGGDENVLTVRNGNKVIKVVGFKMEDTAKTVEHLDRLFRDNLLKDPEALIFGDAGGLGKPILDQLRNRGWHNIRYVTNQSSPKDQRVYHNRGVELWFTMRKFMENGEIILLDDERLKGQLSSRYYKQTDQNKLQLESKLQARSKGHPSPDRADSLVLAFSNYRSKYNDADGVERPLPPRVYPENKSYDVFTLKQAAIDKARPDALAKYYGSEGQQRIASPEISQLVREYNDSIRNSKPKELELTTTT